MLSLYKPTKHATPMARPFLDPEHLFAQTYKKSTICFYIPNIKVLGRLVSD